MCYVSVRKRAQLEFARLGLLLEHLMALMDLASTYSDTWQRTRSLQHTAHPPGTPTSPFKAISIIEIFHVQASLEYHLPARG